MDRRSYSKCAKMAGRRAAKECGVSVGEVRAAFDDYMYWIASEIDKAELRSGMSREEFMSECPKFRVPYFGYWTVPYRAYKNKPNGIFSREKVYKKVSKYDKYKEDSSGVHGDSSECE